MNALSRLLGAVRRRERLADAAFGLARFGLPTGLFTAAVAIFAIRIVGLGPQILWLTAAPVPIILAWAFARPRSLRATARKVDEHYGLEDELGSALELSKSPPRGAADDPRTAEIVALLQAQAEARASSLQPSGVVDVRVPPPGLPDALALALIAVAAILPEPRSSWLETWFGFPPPNFIAIAEANEGLDLALADPLRQNLRGLSKDKDKVAQTAERILEILDALEKGDIDRAEAFEKLEELEESLAEQEKQLEKDMEEDPGILADAVRELAEALQEHEITEEAGEHFSESRPEEGEEALNEAGKEAEQSDKEMQEAMRKAMEDAEKALAKEAKQNQTDTEKQLDEAERRLRKEQKRESKDPEEKERRLKQLKERVEQLKRKQEREEAAQRKLEQLRRDAQDAANKKRSASDRQRSLEKLSRGAKQAAQKSKQAGRTRQLRDSLEEAKTFVRRAGKQGDSAKRRRQQFKKFSKAAKEGKEGKDGKGNKGKGKSTLLVEGQVGDGEPDMLMEGDGEGEGQGEGESQGEGEGEGDSDGQGEGQGQDGGQGQQPGGDGIGDGSVDPLADPSSMNVNKKNLHVKAKQGRGVSRAEVIRDSSQRGFATESYRKVYTDYRGHAQSALDNEALPPAKRRAVKRYYQYIQPRD